VTGSRFSVLTCACLLSAGASFAQEPARVNAGAAYKRLVQRYRSSDFAAAAEVAAISIKDAQWERDLILQDLIGMLALASDQVEAARVRDRLARTELAIVLLHTDACLQPATADCDAQIGMAHSLVGVLDQLADELSKRFVPPEDLTADDLRGAVHEWFQLAALILAAREGHTFLDFLDRSNQRYPGDPLFILLSANFQERYAAGAVVDISLVKKVYFSEYVGAWIAMLNGARRGYEDALDADPHVTEARLRLGRIQTITGDVKKARNNLEQALSEADTPRLRYLATLFLGAVAAVDDRPEKARAYFEQAWSIVPGAQSAAFALSQLADARGDDAGARRWLARTLAVPFAQRDDPWETYYLGPPPADIAGRLQRLRALLHR